MKRNTVVLVVLTAAVCLKAIAAGAGSNPGTPAAETVSGTKVGFLIPSQCRPVAGSKRSQGSSDEWPAPHTTECALRPACIKSGYGLWVMAEKVFYRFDESGQELALEYLRNTKRTSYNKVEIVGDFRNAEATSIREMHKTD